MPRAPGFPRRIGPSYHSCVGCGLCERVCPLGNIALEGGKPAWRGTCTHCMACICRCPAEAIEYGKHSEGLPCCTFEKARRG